MGAKMSAVEASLSASDYEMAGDKSHIWKVRYLYRVV